VSTLASTRSLGATFAGRDVRWTTVTAQPFTARSPCSPVCFVYKSRTVSMKMRVSARSSGLRPALREGPRSAKIAGREPRFCDQRTRRQLVTAELYVADGDVTQKRCCVPVQSVSEVQPVALQNPAAQMVEGGVHSMSVLQVSAQAPVTH